MVVKFDASLETPLIDLPTKFASLADQSTEVTDRSPQVINEDSPAVIFCGGGGAYEDGEVV